MSEADLIDAAEALERDAREASRGARGVSYRRAQEALGVRYDAAKSAVDSARTRLAREQFTSDPEGPGEAVLPATAEPVDDFPGARNVITPAVEVLPIEYANGFDELDIDAIAARL